MAYSLHFLYRFIFLCIFYLFVVLLSLFHDIFFLALSQALTFLPLPSGAASLCKLLGSGLKQHIKEVYNLAFAFQELTALECGDICVW